jgi:hypothetical protein
MSALSLRIIGILLDPRILGALAAAGLVVGIYLHYTGLRDDLATARSDLASMTTRAETAEQLANRNAAAALKADIDRRAAISALESAQTALKENSVRSRDAESTVRSAPDSDDGPVAPLLEDLRQRRFQ